MTMNAKSPETPGGSTANVDADGCPPEPATTARTIASRHVSVRDSAHEFHIPAAQFSVSKYQLMPQTGTVAATTAAIGRPVCNPRPSALGTEYRAERTRMARRRRHRSQASVSRAIGPLMLVRVRQRHTLRSTSRVGLRQMRYTGLITSSVIKMATI